MISIHALLAESDPVRISRSRSRPNFYPRSPCGERPVLVNLLDGGIKFLSTLSLRRATRLYIVLTNNDVISIHALLAESDLPAIASLTAQSLFLSTLSLRRATGTFESLLYTMAISIHALLAESDPPHLPNYQHLQDFYPRSPCGERLCMPANVRWMFSFLSTLSLRRATQHV